MTKLTWIMSSVVENPQEETARRRGSVFASSASHPTLKKAPDGAVRGALGAAQKKERSPPSGAFLKRPAVVRPQVCGEIPFSIAE